MLLVRHKLVLCNRLLQQLIRPSTSHFSLWTSGTSSLSSHMPKLYAGRSRICSRIPLLFDSSLETCKVQTVWHKAGKELCYRPFCMSTNRFQGSPSVAKQTASRDDQERFRSEMNIRLMTENSFLSWCRNTYLSTGVGVVMIAESTTVLSQVAGVVALFIATMNIGWGTLCHVTNLIRLRQVSGMSYPILFLNLLGSMLHCALWAFVLVLFIGFLEETGPMERMSFRPAHDVSTESGLDSRIDKKGK